MEKTRIGIRIGTRIEELETSANTPSFRLVEPPSGLGSSVAEAAMADTSFRDETASSERRTGVLTCLARME
jgi:hypothetical protein